MPERLTKCTTLKCCKKHISGSDIKEWQIRLVGGRFLWEGRVEVFLSGEWGTVTDDGTYITDARVVCRQLGYSTSSECLVALKDISILYTGVTHYYYSEFGEGTGAIHLDNLWCYGSEYRLKDCHYDNNTEEDSHYEDWSVYCGRGQILTCHEMQEKLVSALIDIILSYTCII